MKNFISQSAPKFLSCLAYGLVSVSITLFNKAIFSVFEFHYPTFLTLVQVTLSIIILSIFGSTSAVDVRTSGARKSLFGLQWRTAKKVFPLSFFWMLYVQSGVIALRHLTVPMFSALRRSTTVITAFGEYLVFGKVVPPSSMAAIFVMISGAALAGLTDLSFNAIGYAWLSVCVVSTAAFLLMIQILGEDLNLSQHVLLLYNNVLSLPMMLAWFLLASDEWKSVWTAPQWKDPRFVAFLLFSSSQAVLLNLCVFWCTTVNSALVTTIVEKRKKLTSSQGGQMKDLGTSFFGLFIFGDVLFNAANLLGVGLGLSGGIAYSVLSHKTA